MRLVRVGPAGCEKLGVLLEDNTIVDLSDVVDDFNQAFFASGAIASLSAIVARRTGEALAGPRTGAPIARPHQILCIGLNYRDHEAETGQEVPT